MVYSQRRDHLNRYLLNSNKVTYVMLHNDNNNNNKHQNYQKVTETAQTDDEQLLTKDDQKLTHHFLHLAVIKIFFWYRAAPNLDYRPVQL